MRIAMVVHCMAGCEQSVPSDQTKPDLHVGHIAASTTTPLAARALLNTMVACSASDIATQSVAYHVQK